jgi:hypothetical protein
MRWTVFVGLALCLLVGAPGVLLAGDSEKSRAEKHDEGTLDRFEEEAARPGKDRDRDPHGGRGGCGHHRDDCDCHEGDDFASAFFLELGRVSFYASIYGGVGSWVRMQGSSSGELEDLFPPRATGEPLIPFLCVDGQMQDGRAGVSAVDVRTEAGYGPFGFEYRSTHYDERRPEDTLTITRAHFLYRMSFSNYVELDVGPGYATLSGDRSTTGFSLTLPLRVYPCGTLGAELRPSWARMPGGTISDCSLLAVARRSVVSIKAGYRWASIGDVTLNGPVVGAAVNF